jgi:hypothetical protein
LVDLHSRHFRAWLQKCRPFGTSIPMAVKLEIRSHRVSKLECRNE